MAGATEELSFGLDFNHSGLKSHMAGSCCTGSRRSGWRDGCMEADEPNEADGLWWVYRGMSSVPWVYNGK
jgi:hypothetical protein